MGRPNKTGRRYGEVSAGLMEFARAAGGRPFSWADAMRGLVGPAGKWAHSGQMLARLWRLGELERVRKARLGSPGKGLEKTGDRAALYVWKPRLAEMDFVGGKQSESVDK